MRIKKKKVEAPTPDQILEERVDAMMDPKGSSPEPSESEPEATTADDGALPPLDIFAGATTAPPVPSDLATEIPEEPEDVASQGTNKSAPAGDAGQEIPSETQLDDAVSDAAVDDIVAHESDTVLAAEDAALKTQTVHEPKPKKIHHHPVFWTFITLIVLVAIALALLLVSGGNWQLPGPLQSAKNALSK
ncbi:MAG TPA: hypothetical protein VFI84_01165 [Candidatus Saccharimonadales bacterium]|nr:hypothetical protein [Candidatus Saccharimonadales bacterium]